jgi:hypothetical protein
MTTCLEKLSRANRWRIKTGMMRSEDTAGWNGCFLVPLEGDMWHVTISDGMGWKHLSIKNAQRRTLPTWNIMSRVKDLFFSDEEWVIQYHPAREDYINDHPWVLHLWRPLNEELPKPPVHLI